MNAMREKDIKVIRPTASVQSLHQNVLQLISIADTRFASGDRFQGDMETVLQLARQIAVYYDERIRDKHTFPKEDAEFEAEWSTLAWLLLLTLSRVAVLPFEHGAVEHSLNLILVELVNLARPVRPPPAMDIENADWKHFWQSFANTLNSLHNLYSQLDSPSAQFELSLTIFSDNELRRCLDSFRVVAASTSEQLLASLRRAELDRLIGFPPDVENQLRISITFYHNIMYTLGVLAARLQGFRFEAFQAKSFLSLSDPIRPLLDLVIFHMETLLADTIYPQQTTNETIFVTNNLFPFQCSCLARPLIFKDYHIQIISEESAVMVQDMIRSVKRGERCATDPITVPSAALLALKPTTGVKRNNATASAEGGNTAHKKSDVNSKEEVVINPVWNTEIRGWLATYPHILCTTRQKDTSAFEKSSQIGKRPMFYFFIRGTFYSPLSTRLSFAYSLSIPFAISTRRNQDCQVQRMMSSYSGTCFWSHGTANIEGFLLNWNEEPVSWERFRKLLQLYLKTESKVDRSFSEDELNALVHKSTCFECRENSAVYDAENPPITYKNMLCPHLRYECCEPSTSKEETEIEQPTSTRRLNTDTRDNVVRFSIWRGILEVIQMFTDTKTCVSDLWEDGILTGFSDVEQMKTLMERQTRTALAVYISMALGGSVCFVVRRANGSLVHLEPIDLKRLQTKPLTEYLFDIALDEKVETIITSKKEAIAFSSLKVEPLQARIKRESVIASNISHGGDCERTVIMTYTGIRVAVMACDQAGGGGDKEEERPPSVEEKTREKFEKKMFALIEQYEIPVHEVASMLSQHCVRTIGAPPLPPASEIYRGFEGEYNGTGYYSEAPMIGVDQHFPNDEYAPKFGY